MTTSHMRTVLFSVVLCCLCGASWFLAGADFDIWPLAWIGTLPLLWVVQNATTRKQAFMYGWLAGTIANVGGFYWITNLLVRFGHLPLVVAILGLILLAAYQGLVFGLFGYLTRRIADKHPTWPMTAIAPCVMVTCELLIPFLFPWYLAITQAWIVPMIQIADITGPLGVGFLLVLFSSAAFDLVYYWISRQNRPADSLSVADNGVTKRAALVSCTAATSVIVLCLCYGFWRIHTLTKERQHLPSLKVGVVQGNIPFDQKGINRPALAARQLQNLQDQSRKLEQQGAELVVWSESSYPYSVARDQPSDFPVAHEGTKDSLFRNMTSRSPTAHNRALQQSGTLSAADRKLLHKQITFSRKRIRRNFSVPLLFGAVTYDANTRQNKRNAVHSDPFNSAVLLDSAGDFQGMYDKNFLMMFGEYTPFVSTFPSLRKFLPKNAGQFAKGTEVMSFPLVVDNKPRSVGPMICYEDILPRFGRKLAAHHPDIFINITNDAWFGDTTEPWQHLALSVFRSVESRVDMVRAVNTGVSAHIDATGRVVKKTYAIDPLSNNTPMTSLLANTRLRTAGQTFYAKFGEVFGYLCLALTLLLLWRTKRQN